MILNVIRYRARKEAEWRTWKFSHAAGRLRSYLCISAPRQELSDVAAALAFAVTGDATEQILEVALQLADDGGHTWLVQRRGASTRILKNGLQLPEGSGEGEMAAALLEQVDAVKLKLHRYELQSGDGELRLLKINSMGTTPAHTALSLKEVAQEQIKTLAQGCAAQLNLPQLVDSRLILQLSRGLEPLHVSYQELARQYKELKEENQGFVARELPQVAVLASEIELLDQLAETAAPLLQPGVSLKGIKEELARADAKVSELCAQLSIAAPEGRPVARDFRAAIGALSQLEAQTKLIRATQQTRQYFEQKIAPLHKRYLELAESGLASDRQVAAELESCLASLGLRLRQAAGSSELDSHKHKTWFERFKAREGAPPAAADAASGLHDIETAHMAIAYALKRVQQLDGSLAQARGKHEQALTAVDQGHEELVRRFAKTKEHWLTVARAAQLPEDMDLNQLLQVAVKHGELAALSDLRAELMQKIQRYGARLTRAERLVLDWRKLTGSQNVTDLSNASILLSEVQGILRYHDNKRKRLEQLRDAAAEVKATASIREMLKNRRKALVLAWREVFSTLSLPTLEIHDDRLTELFHAASMIKALAVVHAAHKPEENNIKLIDGAGDVLLSIYSWDEEKTTQKQRLALLQAIEDLPEGELRVFLIADRDLAAMLVPAGMGRATLVEKPVVPAAAVSPQEKRPPEVVPPAVRVPHRVPVVAAQPLLSERARRALETLTVKK